MVSPPLTTSQPGELLVAFLAADGPNSVGGQSYSSVTGGGLTWALRVRSNTQNGTAEIWQAYASTTVNQISVTATLASAPFQQSIVVAAIAGATASAGAVIAANGTSGAPTATLTTTAGGSWVWGVGNDWDNAVDHPVGPNQVQVDQTLSGSGDTYWVQRQAAPTQSASTQVTLNDTAPTNDRWDLAIIEILSNSSSDKIPPTVSITAPAPGATLTGTTTVSANATDDVAVASVQFQLDGINLSPPLTAAPYNYQWDTTTASSQTHTLTAIAIDTAGNQATSSPITITVANQTDASRIGQWSALTSYPEVNIHAALLNTGKILSWQGDFSQGGLQFVLDPNSGTVTQVPTAAADLFCAGQVVLADGRVLVVGGTKTSGGLGTTAVTAFDPSTQTWQPVASMNRPRWYPTATTLSDGKVLVTSGDNTSFSDIVPVPEIYDPAANTWTLLNNAVNAMPVYPFIYQLPDGRILHAGGSEAPTPTEVLDLNTQAWSTVDGRTLDAGSIVNYAPGRFMKAGSASDAGGSGNSTNAAYVLDMTQPSPTWQPTSSMAYPRAFFDLVPLPDGTVLAVNGSTDKSAFISANAVLQPELWNPATGAWSTLAPMAVGRMYHSTALLLPDGRVWVSGGGGDGQVPNQPSYQIYSPPYLFKGARPAITTAPPTISWNSSFQLQSPDATSIARVSLIRTGSSTHAFDENNRALSLTYQVSGNTITVQAPTNGNYAPPGYYLLSIVNQAGVPSTAAMVTLGGAVQQTPPVISGLSTSNTGSTATTVSWTTDIASTSQVKYGTTTAYGSQTTIDQTPVTTHRQTLSNLSPGTTYHYAAVSADAAGSTTSRDATFTTAPSTGMTVDVTSSTHQDSAATTMQSAPFSTTGSNEVVLALLTSDGLSAAQSFASVAGGGLTWTLQSRANAQPGTAEIWAATAPGPLSNAVVTATRASGSYTGSITIVGITGAAGTGATASGSATSGAPSATLTASAAGSFVYAVGNDWDNAIARTVASDQTLVDQSFSPTGDTYWVQRLTATTPAAAAAITMSDTAPTTDRWDLAVVEVVPAH